MRNFYDLYHRLGGRGLGTSEELAIAIIKRLPSKLSKVVKLYYGLNGDAKSLKEIGEKLEISPSKIRQLREQAINKINLRLFELHKS